MRGWIKSTIGEICDTGGGEVKTGPFGSQLHQSDYQNIGIPVVMPADIINEKIDQSRIARVSRSHVDRLYKYKLSKGDIIYGRRGDIGRQALVSNENAGWLCGTGCLRISLGNATIIPEFLHLYLKRPEIIGWIQNQAIGATMPNLNTNILRRVPVRYPESKEEQGKIAGVVFTYDDLIENNKRRIALLEKMAEEIYREWFVRMRFPGREKVKFKKGIPHEWGNGKILDVASFKYGYTESATYDQALPKFLRVMDINKSSYITWNSVPHCLIGVTGFDNYRLKRNDIVIARMADPGKVAIVEEDINAVFASYLIKLNYNPAIISPYYFFYTLSSDYYRDYFTNANSGATRGSINAALIGGTDLLLPPYELMELFDLRVSSIREQMRMLCNSNEILVKNRDRLLTRLISGKLSVESLGIQFPPSIQGQQDVFHA